MHFVRGVRLLLCGGLAIAAASCHGNIDDDPSNALAKVVPASVSVDEAWRLFDRSTDSGFTPSEQPIQVDFGRDEAIAAVKVRGGAPYVVEVRGNNGAAIGFDAIDLSSLTPGWHVIRAAAIAKTSRAELRFRALGAPAPVPELEIWASSTEDRATNVDLTASALPSGFVVIGATDNSKTIDPGSCAAFAVELARPPAVFRRIHLAYEATGLFRAFSLERSINARPSTGGTWIVAGESLAKAFAEEIDPSTLGVGINEVRLCVPTAASQPVTLKNLHLVGELDRGRNLTAKATAANQRDASALLDGRPETTVSFAAGERLLLDFDRLIAPDALIVNAGDVMPRVECITKTGTSEQLAADDAGDAIELDGGARSCRALAVTFSSAITLGEIDVLGSGAAETVDWPHLVVTSPTEHFGKQAWVGGFVARPPVMRGAIRVDVAERASDAMTGDFGRIIERAKDLTSAWPVDISARFPDGTQQVQRIVLDADHFADLVARQQAQANGGLDTNDARFGKLGTLAITRATLASAAKLQVGSLAGLDIPAGAVTKPTDIKGRHIDDVEVPPLDPGMINVTAPKGHGYEFLPHGQHFAKPVEVTVPFDTALIPSEMSVNDVFTFYYDTKAKRWKKLNRQSIDLGDHTAHSTTDHFTIMINAVLAVPTNPTPRSFDPTALSGIAAASPGTNIDLIAPPQANSMGDARLALPIRLPAGRGAYTPSLGLSYSSENGNSWLGVGWDLSTSRIEIDTRWGVPTYGSTEEPRYMLDGAELVPTLDTDGPTCTGAVRYHTRVEGGFAHILRCGTDRSSFWFEVRDRNGTRFVYGGTPTSVLASYRVPFGVFSWRLREVVDVHGNKTKFTYQFDDVAGVNGSEQSHEIYPATIEYTEHTSLAAHYKVEFVLDDHTRPDKLVSGRSGFKVLTRHLLRAVRVKFDNTIIREYVLTYAHGQFQKSVLSAVRVYGLGGCTTATTPFDPPTCPTTNFLDEHSFTYFQETEGFTAPTPWTVNDDPEPAKASLSKGDSTTKSASLELGWKPNDNAKVSVGANGFSGERSELIGTYDMNGDGLIDQVFKTDDGIVVLYNQLRTAHSTSFASDSTPQGMPGSLGHESSGGWGVDAKVGVKAHGMGASASGGFSSSKSTSDRFFTDLDGDGFIDMVAADGSSLRSHSCGGIPCFEPFAFEATNSIDPKLDPVLNAQADEIRERLILGDPVVRWQAPYAGTINVNAQVIKARMGGTDGVGVELYHDDTLLTGVTLGPDQKDDPVNLSQTSVSVAAGESIYFRITTGADDGISKDGQLFDEVYPSLTIGYQTLCFVGSPCVTSTGGQEPTGAAAFNFGTQIDGRITGTQPYRVPVDGTIRVRGILSKQGTSAPLRACLQRFGREAPVFDTPCSSTVVLPGSPVPVTNVSGTFSFTQSQVVSQPFDISVPVQVGETLVLRVEADYSYNPDALVLLPPADQSPVLAFTEVCLPNGTGTTCSIAPGDLARVPVDSRTFAAFAAPVSAPYPAGTSPISFKSTGAYTHQIQPFNNPLYPASITIAIRSSRQGTISESTCSTSLCGRFFKYGVLTYPAPPFSVWPNESVSIEIVADNVLSSPTGYTVPMEGGDIAEARVVFRNRLATPLTYRTPFAGGYRGFSTTFWNENVPFEPTRLLADISPGSPPPSEERLAEIASSAVEPFTYADYAPTRDPFSYVGRAWSPPGSAAYSSFSRMNAAPVGVMQPGDTVDGIFGAGYARMTNTSSRFLGVTVNHDKAKLEELSVLGINATLSWSESKSSADVVDLTGDGIADVIDGDRIHVSTLVPGIVQTIDDVGVIDGFRRRKSMDYAFGFSGGGATTPQTTSSGRRRSMDSQDSPEHGTVFDISEGLALGRSATTMDIVDVNGDGLPDIVDRTPTDIGVHYNLGGRFAEREVFGTVDGTFAEYDPDVFQALEESTSLFGDSLRTDDVALSHDTTFTQHTSYTADFGFASATYTTKVTSSRTTRQFADLNGDGLPDLLFKDPDDPFIRVQYNTGSGFATPTMWSAPSWGASGITLFPSLSWTDFGSVVAMLPLPDVLAATGTQDSSSYSGSVEFPLPFKLFIGGGAGLSFEKDTYELSLLDINGDGSPDHVLRRGESNDPREMYVRTNQVTGKANLLKTVVRPLGGHIDLQYEAVGNTVDMPHQRQTLSRVEVDDGSDLGSEFASPNQVVQYGYEGGFYSREEKQFMGFHDVLTFRADGQFSEQSFENHNFTLQGSLLSEHASVEEGGAKLFEHTITYEVRDVLDSGGNVVGAHPACTAALHAVLARSADSPCVPKHAVVRSDEEKRYEGAVSKTKLVEDLTFDRFGNVLTSLDHADDSVTTDDVHATAIYSNDTTGWILGRPTSIVVQAGDPAIVLRSRRGFYDTFGDLYQLEVDTTALNVGTATTLIGHDQYGNLNSVTTPPNTAGETQTYTSYFDPVVGTYPVRVTDSFGYESTAVYDYRFGVATTETDTNGAQIVQTLDAFGRLATVRGPYDTSADGLTLTYFPLESPPRAVTVTRTSAPSDYSGALAPAITTETFTDGNGTPVELRKTGVVGGAAGVITSGLAQRDNLGRVTRTYHPFFTSGASTGFVSPQVTPYITTTYDEHDRPAQVTYPGSENATETTSYAIELRNVGDLATRARMLFRTRVTDPNGKARESYADHLGRVLAFVEHPTTTGPESMTRYEYSALGELTKIVDAENNETSLGYDLRGLRTSMRNPDTGLIEDRYDLMGNRIATQEPNHRANNDAEVLFQYQRNRLIGINYPSKPDVTYTYGAPGEGSGRAGRLKSVTDESGTQTHAYGAMGELRQTVRSVNVPNSSPVIFNLRMTSDSLGRQLSVRYPDGGVVNNSYDAAGNLSQVVGCQFASCTSGWQRTFASEIQYDVFGNRTRLRSGNGVVSTWNYDPDRVRLTHITATLPSAVKIQDVSYLYDPGSNPTTIQNLLPAITNQSASAQPGPSTLTFTYDGVDRLKRAQGTAQLDAQKTTTFDQQFDYSASHNLLSKSRVHVVTTPGSQDQFPADNINPAATYTYNATWGPTCGEGSGVRPHLPSQFGDTTSGHDGILFTYDCSGNPTTRNKPGTNDTETLVWDDDGRLVDESHSGSNQHNMYDASGLRVRRASSSNGETIFSSIYFDLENSSQGVRHVFAGDLRVASELVAFASIPGEPVASTQLGTAYFFHTNHLGSTGVLTDQNGAVYESIEYYADGGSWIDRGPSSSVNGYLFNGKPFDKDTGFYDYGQRFYDPRTSLWLGVDPSLVETPLASVSRPVAQSVFAFAGHNPVSAYDPDGRDFFWIREKGGMASSVEYVSEPGRRTFDGVLRGSAGVKRANEASLQQYKIDLDVELWTPWAGRKATADDTMLAVSMAPGVGDPAAFTYSTAVFVSDPSWENFLNLLGDGAGLAPGIPALGTIRRAEKAGLKVVASEARALRAEKALLGSKKHGIHWKEGPARAIKTGESQGQFGSLADVDFAVERAGTLKPGQYGTFDLPAGHSSVVHKPDGTTVPATKVWVRHNATGGTVHAYPME